MRDIFITGSGRSGTSLLAGLFHEAGYFYGDQLYEPREANPKGFFEDKTINSINEQIILVNLNQKRPDPVALDLILRLKQGQFWLARAPIEWKFLSDSVQDKVISDIVYKHPFCFKDPRFSFTLRCWLRMAPEALVLCIYRDPAVTVESILRECRTAEYLYSLNIGVEEVFAVWRETYRRLLDMYCEYPNLYFVSYDDIVSGNKLDELEQLTGARIDRSFPDRILNRSRQTIRPDYWATQVYELLQEISSTGFSNPPIDERRNKINALESRLRAYDAAQQKMQVVDPYVEELVKSSTDLVVKSIAGIHKELTALQEEQIKRYSEFQGRLVKTSTDLVVKNIAGIHKELAALREDQTERYSELQGRLDLMDHMIKNTIGSRLLSIVTGLRSLIVKIFWLARLGARALINHEDRLLFCRIIFRKIPLPRSIRSRARSFAIKHFALFRHAEYGDPSSVGGGIAVEPDITGARKVDIPFARKPPVDGKWLLIAEHRIPTPDKTSGSTRLFAIIDLLSRMGFQITFLSLAAKDQYHWIFESDENFQPYETKLAELGVDVIYGQREAGKHLEQEGWKYKYVFLSYPDVAHALLPTVRAYAINSRVIFDTVDLHGLRFQREAELKNDTQLQEKAEHYKKIEKICITCSDKVIAITDDEKENILTMVPDAEVDVIPNIHTTNQQLVPFTERAGLLFIGHYLHSPNQDAVIYFVSEILPLIHERLPGVKFTMLGSSITDEVRNLQSEYVDAVGYVEDPVPYFSSHRVFVSPLRYGAGMKGKIGQSLSLGLPLVTTSIGAEGMRLENGKTALIEDEPAGFAEAVVRLYTDEVLWNAISHNGLQHIENNYSYDAVRGALGRVFNDSYASDARVA